MINSIFVIFSSLFFLNLNGNNLDQKSIDSINDFPNTIGNYWVYKVTNYQDNFIDTVQVKIIGRILNPNGTDSLTLWQYTWPNKIDTEYVSIIMDTVKFFHQTTNRTLANIFIFPFVINEDYSNNQPSPADLYKYEVISNNDNLVSFNGILQKISTFQIQKMFYVDSWSPVRQFQVIVDDFSPGLGIIEEAIEYQIGSVGNEKITVSENWQLLTGNISSSL